MPKHHHVLSTALDSSCPPTEFRIFKAGLNPTENGYSVLFDARAAKSVLEASARWGVDLMIDLEHEALKSEAAARDDQKDARGWFRLEIRKGELWAVSVRWTTDGARRLTERTQRYVSPAFSTEKVEGQDGVERVTEVINVALVAMPATRGAQALIAASLYGAKSSRVVSARVTRDTVDRLEVVARRSGESVSSLLRRCARRLASAPPGKAELDKIALLLEALGLPPNASKSDVLNAIDEILPEVDEADEDAPAGGVPAVDPTSDAPDAAPKPLTIKQMDGCRKAGITHAEFRERKAAVKIRQSMPKRY